MTPLRDNFIPPNTKEKKRKPMRLAEERFGGNLRNLPRWWFEIFLEFSSRKLGKMNPF